MVIVPLHLPFRSQFPITSMAIYPPTMAHLVMAVFRATPPRSLICTLPLFITFLILRPDQVQLQVLHFRRVLFPCASDVMSSNSMRTLWILVTIVFCFTHQQPTQMQHSSHSPVNSRPSSLSHHPLPSNYHSNHYGSVKVEDDHYSVSCTQSISQPLTDWFSQSSNHHNHNGPSNHYHTTLPPFAQTVPEAEVDNWHAYSAERAQVHR